MKEKTVIVEPTDDGFPPEAEDISFRIDGPRVRQVRVRKVDCRKANQVSQLPNHFH
jgi:hypothetical protein